MLFWIMAASFLLCFSFVRLNYLICVFFGTIALLLLYHFLAPELTLIGQRAIDTLVGTLIGAIAVYVFPTWEYQLLAPQITAVLRHCRRYAQEVFKPKLDAIEYRLTRRNALVALTTLSASHQRMLQDPVSKQIQVHEIGELVLQCNLLVSEIASLAHSRSEQTAAHQLAAFQSTAQLIDKALAGTLVGESDSTPGLATDSFFSMQQSAINMMTICAQLTLPGLRSALKNLHSDSLAISIPGS